MTRNEITGDSDANVQAGVVHGGVHVAARAQDKPPVPRQLPMAVPGFVNRQPQLAELDAFLARPKSSAEQGRTLVISAIAGAPGVGKTALAVHWAHRVRSRYVDGDLYVDMRGYGPGPRIEIAHALETLLRCLHVPPERIPVDVDGRAALYRSVLNDRKVLVLIDNAATADQIRLLLPGSAQCLAIVTSRSALSGLVAREGAQRMVLDVLSLEESLTLLRQVVGAERIDAEPAAAQQIIAYCAYLPLALRIIAERITSRPHTPLSEFVTELADERARLDALGTEDDELSDVRAVFATSYASLAPEDARLFRLLGLHPGPEASTMAATALTGGTVATTRRSLDRLARSHLVQVVATDRYRLHDLLRLYATERAHAEETPQARAQALRMVLDWYLHSVYRAHEVVRPAFRRVALQPSESPVPALEFPDIDAALDWFESERENLTEALRQALRSGRYDLAWRFPGAMAGFFELHGYWSSWPEINQMGIEAATAIGDSRGLARNFLGLGDASWLLGRTDQARDCYQRAATHARDAEDRWAEGFALRQTAVLLQEGQHGAEAADAAERAIAVFHETGDQRGEGMALLTLGACYRQLGRVDEALELHERAIALFTEIGDVWSIAWARCELGEALGKSDRWADAVDPYQSALQTLRTFGDRQAEARALVGLGESYTALDQTSQARTHFRAAEELLDTLDDTQTAQLRERLGNAR